MLRFLLPCLALLLAACGQKGPLYLPAPAPVAVVPAAQSAPPATDAGQDEKDTPDAPAATPQP